jgi:hypothetical protein
MIYQVAYKYRMVVKEFELKTYRMNRYILYMESMDFLEMLNFSLKNKIKYFYKYRIFKM